MRELINEILREHTALSEQQIEEFTDRDFYMTAEQAADYGIVDRVLDKEPGSQDR